MSPRIWGLLIQTDRNKSLILKKKERIGDYKVVSGGVRSERGSSYGLGHGGDSSMCVSVCSGLSLSGSEEEPR